MTTETWRVVLEGGREIRVDLDASEGKMWCAAVRDGRCGTGETQRKAISWALCDLPVCEVLAPGEMPRAEMQAAVDATKRFRRESLAYQRLAHGNGDADKAAAVAKAVERAESAEQTVAEMSAVMDRMTTILNATANALKGPPGELCLHSWHDLAEVARAVVVRAEQALATVTVRADMAARPDAAVRQKMIVCAECGGSGGFTWHRPGLAGEEREVAVHQRCSLCGGRGHV
jgi:hypothetical protein